MYTDKELTIRPITYEDLSSIWEFAFKEDAPEWKQWDAPYFPHHSKSLETFRLEADQWVNASNIWVVTINNEVCGTVSYYYDDEQMNWLEMGIVIYESTKWNSGIGTRALSLWANHLFDTLPTVRIGLTTWSGNVRMIRVAEKLGMVMEGRIRKVRYYQGKYFDSIRMGILREEWDQNMLQK